MTDTYVYAPLDLSKDSLRLLRLCKGHPGAEIQCEIFQSLLSESEGIPYEALSYTWGGEPTDTSPCILLDGQRFSVTKNLFDALHALRLRNLDRLLWIDALCINQQDHREKGHQVGQMRSVYRNADMVLVWLGPSSSGIDDLMEMMMSWGKLSSTGPQTLPTLEASWSATIALFKVTRGHIYDSNVSHLERLLSERAWFKRVWVIQEVANARAAVIMCGSTSISSRIFSTMPHLMGLKISPNIRAVLDVMPGPLRKESWWKEDRRLITLLTKFHGSEATQEHDKIYALLGIASDAGSLDLPIDYSCPFQQVVDQTVSSLILGSSRLSHLLNNKGRPTFEFSEVFRELADTHQLALRVFQLALKNSEETYLKHMVETSAVNTMAESISSKYEWDLPTSEWVFDVYSRANGLELGHTPLMAALDATLLKRYDIERINSSVRFEHMFRLQKFFRSMTDLQFQMVQRIRVLKPDAISHIFKAVAYYSGTDEQMQIFLRHL